MIRGAFLLAGALSLLIVSPAAVLGPVTGLDGFWHNPAYAAGPYDMSIGEDGVGQDGKSGQSGKSGKNGEAGKDGKAGKPGGAGKPGQAGKPGTGNGKPGKGKPGTGNGKPGKGKPGNGKGACTSPCEVPADVRKKLDSMLERLR